MSSGPDPQPQRSGFLHLSRFLPEEEDQAERVGQGVGPIGGDIRGHPSTGSRAPFPAVNGVGDVGPEPLQDHPSDPDQEGAPEALVSAPTGSVDAVRLLDHAGAEAARIVEDARDRAMRILDEACSDATATAARLLADARREADQLLTDARREADTLRQEALRDATRLRTEAETAVLAARDQVDAEADRRRLELDQAVRGRYAAVEAESAGVVTDARQQALKLLKDAEREREEMLAQARREADRLLDLGAHAIAGAERQAATLLEAAAEAAASPSRDGRAASPGDIGAADLPTPTLNAGTGTEGRTMREDHRGAAGPPVTPILQTADPDDSPVGPVIGSRGRVVGRGGQGDPGPGELPRMGPPGVRSPAGRRRRGRRHDK